MARSEETTNWLGDKITVHYNDDGDKIGESRNETTILGTPYVEHRDAHGNKVGESRNETTILGTPYVEHRDTHGNKVGESSDETTVLGTHYVEHRDARGNELGQSHDEKDWAGKRYKSHSGTAPYLRHSSKSKPSKDSEQNGSTGSNYSASEWSSSASGSNPQTSQSSGDGIVAFVIIAVASVIAIALYSTNQYTAVPKDYVANPSAAPVSTPVWQSPLRPESTWQRPGTNESQLLEQAHAEIDQVYNALLNSLNSAQQEVVRKEEREWIKWRDSEAERIAHQSSVGGSAYRVDYLNAMRLLVQQRTQYLRNYKPFTSTSNEQRVTFEKADAEINHAYKQALESLNSAQKEVLRHEEREWIKWRDAEADRIAHGITGGDSRFPVVRMNVLTNLIRQRTGYLSQYRPVR
jgi:uncharacterized protein YecT (DUF1311 family)